MHGPVLENVPLTSRSRRHRASDRSRLPPALRPPSDDEPISLADPTGNLLTLLKNPAQAGKKGDKVAVKGELKGRKNGELTFFKPEKKEGDVWVPKANTFE